MFPAPTILLPPRSRTLAILDNQKHREGKCRTERHEGAKGIFACEVNVVEARDEEWLGGEHDVDEEHEDYAGEGVEGAAGGGEHCFLLFLYWYLGGEGSQNLLRL
eukprot:CAMPEP_0201685852 /NCGR_PEP_ID=MMETSP0578-20130828/522_1 /ASSEMBLY_ACC=CAM_ASM_000663 /TAXON_ID=267565 /ORGANISM="Skeletonema grethea, Strain CCMP 1804" /LENGTH=104 /DNA_ID=CAMNT_0048169829 /DNA_START=397 /DNA_END=711 /DNA_ORIENTATION=-